MVLTNSQSCLLDVTAVLKLDQSHHIPLIITPDVHDLLVKLSELTDFIHLATELPPGLTALRLEPHLTAEEKQAFWEMFPQTRVVSLAPQELLLLPDLDLAKSPLLVITAAERLCPLASDYDPCLRLALGRLQHLCPQLRLLFLSTVITRETLNEIGCLVGRPLQVYPPPSWPDLQNLQVLSYEERASLFPQLLTPQMQRVLVYVRTHQQAEHLARELEKRHGLRTGIYERKRHLQTRRHQLAAFAQGAPAVLLACDPPPLAHKLAMVIFYEPPPALEDCLRACQQVVSDGRVYLFAQTGCIEESFARLATTRISFRRVSALYTKLSCLTQRQTAHAAGPRGVARCELPANLSDWEAYFVLEVLQRHQSLRWTDNLPAQLPPRAKGSTLPPQLVLTLNLPGARNALQQMVQRHLAIEAHLLQQVDQGWFDALQWLKKFNQNSSHWVYPQDLTRVLHDWECEGWVLVLRQHYYVSLKAVPPPACLSEQVRQRAQLLRALVELLQQQCAASHTRREVRVQLPNELLRQALPQYQEEELARGLLFLVRHDWVHLVEGAVYLTPLLPLYAPWQKQLTIKGSLRKAVLKKIRTIYAAAHQQSFSSRVRKIHHFYHYLQLAPGQQSEYIHDYQQALERDFHQRYFSEVPLEQLALPVRPADQQKILGPLSEAQRQIVQHTGRPLLVLAGPGSGKTRSLVHRAAYLLKFQRLAPARILVLAYNRMAVRQFRTRLSTLVGPLAMQVPIMTFHQLALKITGKSFSDYSPAPDDAQAAPFESILRDALDFLGNQSNLTTELYAVLSQLEAILVDEYQDVDAWQYQFLKSICGLRVEENERITELDITVVGDDDQNIYSFRGTSVRYLRDFQHEYGATVLALTENFRSTQHIIAAAAHLIAHNCNRSKKQAHLRMRIDRARTHQPAGGRLAAHDRYEGRVAILDVIDTDAQGYCIAFTLFKMHNLFPDLQLGDFAIFARSRDSLVTVQGILEGKGIKTQLLQRDVHVKISRRLPFWQTLEILKRYRQKRVAQVAPFLRYEYRQAGINVHQPSIQYLLQLAAQYDEQNRAGALKLPLDDFIGMLYQISEIAAVPLARDRVVLSSLHGAKGLEFPVVFILADSGMGMANEEQRRLYYVAMTRAKEKLYLFRHKQRPAESFTCELTGHPAVTEVKYTFVPDPAEIYQIMHLCQLRDLFPSCRETRAAQERIQALEEEEPLRVHFYSAQRAGFLTDEGELIGLFSRNFSAFLYATTRGQEQQLKCWVAHVERFYEGAVSWWLVRPALTYPRHFAEANATDGLKRN